MKSIEAVLSDADGTLVDTVQLIRHGQYETAKTYLEGHDIHANEIPDYDRYEVLLNQAVGGSARDTLERTVRLLYESQPHYLDGIDFDALHNMLNPIQDRIAPEFVKPYEGLSETLKTLGSTGIKLAVFTSGTPHHVVRNFSVALPEVGLTTLSQDKSLTDQAKLDLFTAKVQDFYRLPAFTVVTADDTLRHKPDPEGLNLAMQRLGVLPDASIVLGDHKVDMQTAISAGVKQRIGITHGFDDKPTLEAAGATEIIDSLNELTALLTK